jgi:hypothetical protein
MSEYGGGGLAICFDSVVVYWNYRGYIDRSVANGITNGCWRFWFGYKVTEFNTGNHINI